MQRNKQDIWRDYKNQGMKMTLKCTDNKEMQGKELEYAQQVNEESAVMTQKKPEIQRKMQNDRENTRKD